MAGDVKPEVLETLLGDVERLRRQLDDLLVGAQEVAGERLDMAYVSLQDLVASSERVDGEPVASGQLKAILKDLHRALASWRLELEERSGVPSSVKGTVRELQDRAMRLIAGGG